MFFLICDSVGWSPVRLGPSKGSLPHNRAKRTTPKDQISRGGPIKSGIGV